MENKELFFALQGPMKPITSKRLEPTIIVNKMKKVHLTLHL